MRGGGSSLTGISIQQLNTRPRCPVPVRRPTGNHRTLLSPPCPGWLIRPTNRHFILLHHSVKTTPPRQTGLSLSRLGASDCYLVRPRAPSRAQRCSTVQMVDVGWTWKHSRVLFMHRQDVRCCYALRDRRTCCRKVATEMGDAKLLPDSTDYFSSLLL